MVNAVAMPGIARAEAAHLEDLARVGLLVDEADQREEEPGHHAVGEHLEDGAVEPASVSVAAPSITRPMCETDEYAMTYLRSVCAMAESAP